MLGQHEYDPSLKRFVQPDPSAQDGVRSYVYCHDDPVNCADPSGLAGGPIETPLPEPGTPVQLPLFPPEEGDFPTVDGSAELTTGSAVSAAGDNLVQPSSSIENDSIAADEALALGTNSETASSDQGYTEAEGTGATDSASGSGKVYSVAYQTRLPEWSYPGGSRGTHNDA